MTFDDKLILIHKVDFVSQLSKDEYGQLRVMDSFMKVPKGAYVYFDAQHHDKLYFVKKGHVKIGMTDDDGNEIIKDILQQGDVFGQFTLEKNNMSGEFAQAYKSDVTLCCFRIADFEYLLQQKPLLAIHFSKIIGFKLKRVEFRLCNLLQKDVRTRLLYFLWTMFLNNRSDKHDTITIPNYLTHDDIARLIATSRQTVTTLINQLEDEGLIAIDRKHITIYDIKKLSLLAKVG